MLGNTVPAALQNAVLKAYADNIARFDGHLTYGSVGALHTLQALSESGLYELAVNMATQRTFPSFGYWLANGATTCWENWSGVPDGS